MPLTGYKSMQFYKVSAIAGLLFFVFASKVLSQYNESVMKAAYIERITRFIEWPEKHWSDTSSKFVFAVFGDNEFLRTIEQIFRDQKIKDRNVVARLILNPSELRDCDLCFIGSASDEEMKKITSEAKNAGVLMFSESDALAKSGIHINFYIEADKLKFEINRRSLDNAKFRVSSLLMSNSKVNDR